MINMNQIAYQFGLTEYAMLYTTNMNTYGSFLESLNDHQFLVFIRWQRRVWKK